MKDWITPEAWNKIEHIRKAKKKVNDAESCNEKIKTNIVTYIKMLT